MHLLYYYEIILNYIFKFKFRKNINSKNMAKSIT